MITKEDEYTAEICKIGGFAFVAPFGKVILSFPYLELFELTSSQMLYIAFTISLACIGVLMINSGRDRLKEKRY